MGQSKKIIKRIVWIIGGLLGFIALVFIGIIVYMNQVMFKIEQKQIRPLDPSAKIIFDTTQAFNPYLPAYEYIPDAEPRLFGDRIYIYGSQDRFNGKTYCLNDYVTWSASIHDPINWRYEGVIYKKTQDPLNADGSTEMNAPDVIQGADGRYYMYYSLAVRNELGIAVSDTPAGKYTFLGYVSYPDGRLFGNKENESTFDPGIFIDDDGRIYLYTGFSITGLMKTIMSLAGMGETGYSMVTELEQDMKTIKTDPTFLIPGERNAAGTSFEGHGFFEACSVRKINGKYYLIYSSNLSHELCYAISDSPDKGFIYKGTIVSNADIGLPGITSQETARNYIGNTHGSLIEVNGKWYVFYHRQTNQHSFSRQGCIEEIKILPDGSIPQVEITSLGMNGKPLKGLGQYSTHIACNLYTKNGTMGYDKLHGGSGNLEMHPYFTQDGPDREEKPFQYIANFRDGSTAGFKYFEFDGANNISVRVRGIAEGKLIVHDDYAGNEVAEIEIKSDSSINEFKSPLRITSGTHPLFFTYEGEGAIEFLSFELIKN